MIGATDPATTITQFALGAIAIQEASEPASRATLSSRIITYYGCTGSVRALLTSRKLT